MSDVIDNSIVQMQFDNRQFESGIAQSLDSIQRLKNSLDFSKSLNAFETITKSIKSVSFDPLVTIWQTSLTRMTNIAIDTGKKITKALMIDPVFTGFQEYTTQIDAVQTILANTEKYGTTLNDINKALDELNYYADKTIYNFTQMTQNIGRFTAAGVELDPAVKSIEGMSNLAASSGATAEQASRAYYQMSQALAGIGLRLMDYNSLVNAGMGGQLFQEALKQTSKDVKKTTEEYVKFHASGMSVEDISKKFGVSIDEVHKILSNNYNKDVDAAIKKTGSFRDSLNQGWATADILQRTFAKFSSSGMVEYLHEFTGVSKLALEELQEIGKTKGFDSKEFEERAKALKDLNDETREEIKLNLKQAQTAEDAATKVRTFKQLKDTVKEAVQSGWTQTWEYIIGDFEQAKEFFTRISDYLGDIIGRYSDFRNKIVGDWSRGGGRKAVIEGLWNVVKTIEGIVKPLKNAWNDVMPPINLAAILVDISKGFEKLTAALVPNEKLISKVTTIYQVIFRVFEELRVTIGDLIGLFPRFNAALTKSPFSGVLKIFENSYDANRRGGLISFYQDLYKVLDDMGQIDVSVLDDDGKLKGTAKLSAFGSYTKLLASVAKYWGDMQSADISKLGKNASDIPKLNDALLKMAYGIEDGNRVFEQFKSMNGGEASHQEEFLKYLQDEFKIDVDVAEDIYKRVNALSEIEEKILRWVNVTDDGAHRTFMERMARFFSDILGVDYDKTYKLLANTIIEINNGLAKLKETFAETVKAISAIDYLLSALLVVSLVSINDYVIKPIYKFIADKWIPIFQVLYEAITQYALPALGVLTSAIFYLVKTGLGTLYNNVQGIVTKLMRPLEIFAPLLTLIVRMLADDFYAALQKIASLNPQTLFEDLWKAFTDWVDRTDQAVEKFAGVGFKTIFKNIIDDILWVWSKIDGAIGITNKIKDLFDRIKRVMDLWYGLGTYNTATLKDYWYQIEAVFGRIEDSKIGQIGKRIGNGLYSIYVVIHGIITAFKEFVDNPDALSLPDRVNLFFDKIASVLWDALTLNGFVNDKFLPLFNTIMGAFKLLFGSIVSLIPVATYATAGIRPVISNLFTMFKEFTEQNGIDVKSIATAVGAILIITILINKLIKGLSATSPSYYTISNKKPKGFSIFNISEWIEWTFLEPARRAVDKLSKVFDLWTRATATLDNINSAINAFKHALKVGEIVAVAASIAVISGSVYVLATIPAEQLASVVASMGVLFAELGILLLVVTKTTGNVELGAVTTVFASIAAMLGGISAVLYMYNLIEKEGRDPSEAMNRILVLVAGLAAILTAFTFIGNIAARLAGGAAWKTTTAASASIYAIAKAILNLAPAIWVLSNVPADKFGQVSAGLAIIFAGMTAYAWAAGKFNAAHPIEAAVGVMGMAVAMGLVVIAIKELLDVADNPNLGQVYGYIMGIAIVLAAVEGLGYLLRDSEDTLAMVALTFLAMASSIGVIVGSLALLYAVVGDASAIQSTAVSIALLIALMAAFGILIGIISSVSGGTGAAILGGIAGILLAVGGAALMFGMAIMTAGVGLYFMADAFQRLGESLGLVRDTGIQAVEDVTESLTSNLVITISKILANFNAILKEIVVFLEEILPEIETIVNNVLDFIGDHLPGWFRKILEFLIEMFELAKELVPPLQTAIQDVIKLVLDSLIPYLKENLPPWLEDLKPVFDAIDDYILTRIDAFLVRLKEHAGPIADSLMTIMNDILTKMLEPVNTLPEDFIGPPEEVKTRFEVLAEKIAQMIAIIFAKIPRAFIDILPEFEKTMTIIAEDITALLAQQLADSLGAITAIAVETVHASWAKYWPRIKAGLMNIINGLTKIFSEDLPEMLIASGEAVVAFLQYVFMVMGAMIEWVLDAILSLLKQLIDTFVNVIFTMADMIGDSWKRFHIKLIRLLLTSLSTFLMLISGFVNALLDLLIHFVQDDLTEIVDKIDVLARSVIDLFIRFVNNLAATVEEKGPELNDAFARLVTAIVNVIKDCLQKIFTGPDAPLATFVKAGSDIIKGLIEGVYNLWNSLFGENGTLRDLANSIISFFDNNLGFNKFTSIGENVMRGFVNGLKSMGGPVKDLVEKIFGGKDGVTGTAQDELEVHSPSEFFAWLAKMCGLGYEEGIEESSTGIFGAIKNLFSNGISSIFSGISEGENPISNLLTSFIDGWDKDKSFTENIKDKLGGLFSGVTGEGGLLGGLFGEDGLFGGIGDIFNTEDLFSGFLSDENGESIFSHLFDNLEDPVFTPQIDYENINSLGETLSDGKLNTSVANANNRVITSNGTYANAMNDMLNSGQYWNDPNALTNADIVNAIATVVQRLDNIDENMPKEVVLDTGAMVGNLSPEMNKALGRMLRQKGRRT